ncbi:hypothetical protein AV530_007627 [Patagioenas fasciata monilis]|uniref:Uncharacterized protein n=1 Tax=Patagioenas fasciata monilis TaxID=372326 RepID=A0A1V4JYI0_PATFA|nr:hypothetical protein AV530_007627 [Patagioenas fasciata monilis]
MIVSFRGNTSSYFWKQGFIEGLLKLPGFQLPEQPEDSPHTRNLLSKILSTSRKNSTSPLKSKPSDVTEGSSCSCAYHTSIEM